MYSVPVRNAPQPEGAARSMPARGRVFPSSPAWCGGVAVAATIIPPPRREASPSWKRIGGVCSANPLYNRSKGAGHPLPRGQGLRRSPKHQHPCRRFGLFKAASLPPRPCPAATGRTSPTQVRGSVMRRVVRPCTALSKNLMAGFLVMASAANWSSAIS